MRANVRRLFRALLLIVLAGLLLAGCSNRLTRDQFERIQPGMTRAEVEALLGPPHRSYQGILTWTANHERTVITVVLDDQGRVDSKSADGL